ncbi:hypothetical protein GCM10018785_56700 [Streptomyces longispororuber]|uniref:Secreted protein n=1 Tax=Streptomyces longispororuber TaxID=68230 RepID=A0A919A1U5_9ACTN|nr:hypothetical protein [Streptomyces longispororuber]GHE81362.1 hypothetical protein GCM10018785_56700 [Streptomyces longispororuber]
MRMSALRILAFPAAVALCGISGSAYADEAEPTAAAHALEATSTGGVAAEGGTDGDESLVADGEIAIKAAGCPHDGRFGPNSVCTSLSGGAVFHSKYHPDATRTGIKTSYKKSSGSAVTNKLGYTYKGTTHWGAYGSQKKGTTRSKTWTRTDYDFVCSSTVGIMHVKGEGSYQTPVASC